jgi:hypothetical protein
MIQHIAMVLEAEGLNGPEKLLLIAYCNHTDGRGYVTAGIPRLADETGTSERTVKRVNAQLKAKKLIKSARRVNPRTGEPTTNLTRVNLALLASMKRPEREYDDSLIEALTFPEDEAAESSQVSTGDDLAQGSDLLIGQSDTYLGDNLAPTPGQSDTYLGDNLAPNPYPLSVCTDPDPEERTEEAARTENSNPTPPPAGSHPATLEQAAALASRLNLQRLDAKPRQVIQVTQALADALSRPNVDWETVERYAAAKVAEANTVKYLLGAFTPERLTIGLPAYRIAGAAPAETVLPARCDDPRHDPNVPDDRNLYDDNKTLGLCECAGSSRPRSTTYRKDARQDHGDTGAGRAMFMEALQSIGRRV